MLAGDMELDLPGLCPVDQECVRAIANLVIGDRSGAVAAPCWVTAKGDHLAGQALHQGLHILDIAVDDQDPLFVQFLSKKPERMTDILLIGFYVQDDLHGREKGEEAVGIFTGLCHKILGPSHPDIASDVMEDAAYRHGGISPCR